MKTLLMTLMVFFSVSLSTTSYASWRLRSCLMLLLGQKRDTAGKSAGSVPDRGEIMKNEDFQTASYEPRSMIRSQEVISQLVEIQKIAINGRLTRLFEKFSFAFHAGHIVNFKNRELQVITPLGYGSKAIVYLVSDENILRALKVLFDKNSYETEKRNYEFLDSHDVPSVRLIETDEENNQILLSYIDGIPVSGILHNKLVEDELRRMVRIQLIFFGERYARYGRILPDNLILEISSGRIVFIDRE
ncbi:MAG: hypothetical protein IPK68_10360 [Bdellovibrionales bacterium]|nr:hypothetical protein [Bdellovibrionales bacterium]